MNNSDRRQFPRETRLEIAKIIFRGGTTVVSAMLLDRSEGGARLKIVSMVAIPDTINVQIGNEPTRPCRVAWRAGKEIGVAYM